MRKLNIWLANTKGYFQLQYENVDLKDFILFSSAVGGIAGYLEIIFLIVISTESKPDFFNSVAENMRRNLDYFEPFNKKERGTTLPAELLTFSSVYEQFIVSFEKYLFEIVNVREDIEGTNIDILPDWLITFNLALENILILLNKISKEKKVEIPKERKHTLDTVKFIRYYGEGGYRKAIRILPFHIWLYNEFQYLKNK